MSIRKAVSAALAVALAGAFASAAVAKDKPAHTPGNGKAAKAATVFTLSPSTHGNPEGVAWDPVSRSFFVGATGDGTIYRGTTDNPTVGEFITGASGKSAVGMKVFHGKLYVAGGSTGAITVYDIATKAVVASFSTGAGGFLNDLVVTGHGDVYVTDSMRPTLWHVTRAQVKAGGGTTPEAIPLSPEITFVSGFNLNGIVALDNSKRLIVVQSNTGKLFRIDVRRNGGRRIIQIQASPVGGGDGLLLSNGRLVVVQGSPAQLTFLKLKGHATRAKVESVRTDPTLKGPSTIARARNLFLVVNADFATSTQPFTVSGLPRKGDH